MSTRPAPKKRLDQRKATPESDMPECVGNPKMKHQGRQPPPVTLKGFDDRWRCETCHQIHVEIVFKEAGELGPDGTVPKFKPVSKEALAERASALAKIRRDYSPGGKRYERSGFSEQGVLVNRENIREASSLARQMRAKGQDTSGNRVVEAYRAMVAARSQR